MKDILMFLAILAIPIFFLVGMYNIKQDMESRNARMFQCVKDGHRAEDCEYLINKEQTK